MNFIKRFVCTQESLGEHMLNKKECLRILSLISRTVVKFFRGDVFPTTLTIVYYILLCHFTINPFNFHIVEK